MSILPVIEKLHELSTTGKHVTCVWIPGHTDIPGNDQADSLAKECIKTCEKHDSRTPHSDFRHHISNFTKNEWDAHWQNQKHNKLNKIMPTQKRRPKPNLPRTLDTLMTRLRIGHSPYTHSFLLRGEPPPWCIGCDQQITVEHILIECIDFAQSRKKYFKTKNLKTLFDIVDSKSIFGFLHEINLLQKM